MHNKVIAIVFLKALSLLSIQCQTSVDTLIKLEHGYREFINVGDTIIYKEHRTTIDEMLDRNGYLDDLHYLIKTIPYDKKGTMSVFKMDNNVLIWEKTYYGTEKLICEEGYKYDPEKEIEVKHKVCHFERLPHGLWRYYNANNQVETIEIYNMGVLISSIHLAGQRK